MVNNPTGKGGFRDHPEFINKNGAPKRGQTWQETIKRITDMTREEAIEYVGPNTKVGRHLKELSPKMPIKEALIFATIIAYGRDPNARMLQALTDREEGKPKEPANGNAAAVQPLSIPAELIAPDFLSAYRDIKNKLHTEYLFYGGRGSTKSSFVSLAIVYLLVNNPDFHALITRQVKDTLRGSVYSQMTWAIDQLGLTDSFKCTTSPLEIRYIPTGQTIFFHGGDEPGKLKSIKPPFGAIAILWLEELDQFKGAEAVRKIEQSAIRGTDDAYIFKSFNPPRTQNSWVNKYVKIPKASQYQHFSNYLTVPREWLGQAFIDEAEHLKAVAPDTYDHEYMGVANSAGGMIFENVTVRKITAEEIAEFDRIHNGVDWGYYPDPWQWNKMHYDAARRILYIFDELRLYKRGNQETYNELVKEKGVTPEDSIIADSAEPKSVADYRAYGLSCRGAEKGPDSVNYSIKWLQGLTEIVIDNERCPYTAEEFLSYEYERDKNDEIISGYPDRNDHAIAATRYGMNLEWRRRGQ